MAEEVERVEDPYARWESIQDCSWGPDSKEAITA
jgi:hypothetical protein